jgi:hypothetical protein
LIHNIKPTKFGHTREEALRIPGRADGARCALRFWWWVPAPFDVLTPDWLMSACKWPGVRIGSRSIDDRTVCRSEQNPTICRSAETP